MVFHALHAYQSPVSAFDAPSFSADMMSIFFKKKKQMTLITTSIISPLLRSLLLLNDSTDPRLGVGPLQTAVLSHILSAISSRKHYKGARCTPYGSSANGLCTGVSDIDVSIFIPTLEREREQILG